MWDLLTSFLHGLAYLGVWILNVISYDVIAPIIWILIGGFTRYALHCSERKTDDVIRISGGILLIVVCAICVALCFNLITIVPYPVFD